MKLALGILGGMGPQATVDLQQKIINLTAAGRDSEHLRVYVDNHPQIPDRIGAVLNGTLSPVPAMQESLDKLAVMGADCVVMPCVSAHYFLPQLVIPPRRRSETLVLFLDMLQITAQACADQYKGLKDKGLKAGVLCSEATAQSGLITRALEHHVIPSLYPQDQDQRVVGRFILDVKAGANLSAAAAGLRSIAAEMTSRGADYFVLGCTELPILALYEPFPYPYLDATTELAKAAILNCGGKLRE
jgi:aspartate racemase